MNRRLYKIRFLDKFTEKPYFIDIQFHFLAVVHQIHLSSPTGFLYLLQIQIPKIKDIPVVLAVKVALGRAKMVNKTPLFHMRVV